MVQLGGRRKALEIDAPQLTQQTRARTAASAIGEMRGPTPVFDLLAKLHAALSVRQIR